MDLITNALQDRALGCVQVQWNRAARTDKGVSAAGNVVSLKMMIGYPDIVERINSNLPAQVLPLSWIRNSTSPDQAFLQPVIASA